MVLAVSMFVPLFAAIISGKEWKNIGFRPRLKGNVKWLFFAWLVPGIDAWSNQRFCGSTGVVYEPSIYPATIVRPSYGGNRRRFATDSFGCLYQLEK